MEVRFNDKTDIGTGNAWSLFLVGRKPRRGSHPTNTHLWKSTDSCATWANVNANLKEVISYGFGAAKPGGGGYRRFMPMGGSVAFRACTRVTTAVPRGQRSTYLHRSRLGLRQSFGTTQWVTGDMNVYGRIMVGFNGAGATYIDVQRCMPSSLLHKRSANLSFEWDSHIDS